KKVNTKINNIIKKSKISNAYMRKNDYPHHFSLFMQQRIIISIALSLEPQFIIADEPTTALDVTVQNQIMLLLKDLQYKEKMGLIFISHDIEVVANYADRVAVKYTGPSV